MNFIVRLLLNLLPRIFLIKTSLLLKPFFGIFFKGTKFTDPINNKSYSYFFPYGYNKQRKNALCPETFSLERHRLLWLYLKKETDFFNSNNKILHFAPEQCFHKFFKSFFKSYTTTDLNSPIVDIKADICNLPFNDNSFDYILCNHVLEHIYDDEKAMKEIFRVLNKNGIAILQVPIDMKSNLTHDGRDTDDKEVRNKLFGQYDHLRMYGLDYFKKLKKVGFNVKNIDYLSKLTKEEVEKFSLTNAGTIPVCIKD
ncbi:MAG: SAM-dependent methyltransferase [Cryomorphaceae bacterium MED-G14]|nr:MAG: SAM-dependent methyltransferase [Cryomorphaceae bacterium MED-G14]|tara:strand:+ start:23 stop:787 length:765 start_codon:yes stop_codon:yes gene_type:complete